MERRKTGPVNKKASHRLLHRFNSSKKRHCMAYS